MDKQRKRGRIVVWVQFGQAEEERESETGVEERERRGGREI